MNIGRLNKRVLIKKDSTTRNEYGELVGGYDLVATTWAEVKPLIGKQWFEALKDNVEVSHQVTIRYRQDINATMVLFLGDRKLEIASIINLMERNEYLQLMCKEVIT